jgi:hypothetical protein
MMSALSVRLIAFQSEAIAAAAQCFDRFDRVIRIKLLAQATDKDLDHIAVPLEVLIVESIG